MHVRDMPDIHGDAKRGRLTVPLVYVDGAARWSIAFSVAGWSFVCSMLFRVGLVRIVLSFGVPAIFLMRLFPYRSVAVNYVTLGLGVANCPRYMYCHIWKARAFDSS